MRIPAGESQMVTSIEKITPEMAAEFLEANGTNRKISRNVVDRYARAMRAGRWKLSHQGIAFDIDGRLVDGQHRLTAILQSGETIESLVVHNAPRDMFDVLDNGKSRSPGDTLGILGATNRIHCASSLKVMKAYAVAQRENINLFQAMRGNRLENWELEAWFSTYPQVQDWVNGACAIVKATRCLPSTSAATATLTLAARIEPAKTASFVDAMVSMEDLKSGSAVLALFKRDAIGDRGYDGQAMTVITLAKALKLWFSNSRATRLQLPPLSQIPDLGWLPLPEHDASQQNQKGTKA